MTTLHPGRDRTANSERLQFRRPFHRLLHLTSSLPPVLSAAPIATMHGSLRLLISIVSHLVRSFVREAYDHSHA